MVDTLKTATIGVTGSATAHTLYWTEWVPPLFSALAAVATLIYMIIKIKKEVSK